MVRQVELRDLGIGQVETVTVLVALEQLALDDPVDLRVDLRKILSFDGIEGATPQVDYLLDLRVRFAVTQVFDCLGVVFALNVEGTGLTTTS